MFVECALSSVNLQPVAEAYEAATFSMARLNRTGAKLMQKYGKCSRLQSHQHSVTRLASMSMPSLSSSLAVGAHGATDVTGFGILGHARNLASSQKAPVSFKIHMLPSRCQRWLVLAQVFFYTCYNQLSPVVATHNFCWSCRPLCEIENGSLAPVQCLVSCCGSPDLCSLGAHGPSCHSSGREGTQFQAESRLFGRDFRYSQLQAFA